MDRLDVIIQLMDNILKEQECMKCQLSDIVSKLNKQEVIITAIEEKITRS